MLIVVVGAVGCGEADAAGSSRDARSDDGSVVASDAATDARSDTAKDATTCLPAFPECRTCSYNVGHDCVGTVCLEGLYCAPLNTPGEPPGYGACAKTKPCGAPCTTNRECASNVCSNQRCQ